MQMEKHFALDVQAEPVKTTIQEKAGSRQTKADM